MAEGELRIKSDSIEKTTSDLSTSNRATLGGMINTDASGQGSLQYGKTSDHVLALKAVLADGSVLDTEAIQQNKWLNSDVVSRALKITEEVCRDKRQQVLDKHEWDMEWDSKYDKTRLIELGNRLCQYPESHKLQSHDHLIKLF